jgi:leucyl aminopeptidase
VIDLRTPASRVGTADMAAPSGSPAQVRLAAGVLAREFDEPLALDCVDLSGAQLTALAEGLLLGGHRLKGEVRTRVELVGVTDADAVAVGRENANATLWARDLANTPAAVKTPAWLGKQAERALRPAGVEVDVHDAGWLAEHGFGGVLAVGGGSVSPPTLIEARYRPRGAAAAEHVVLVGKGITFDTGGLNLKRGTGMRMMHTDMSGGAAVLAALRLLATRRVPVRVTALVPAAENSFGAASFRPGDVVRHVNGRTSEITNTDAEGRLVLADALAYAVRRLRPSTVVDIATLTGAMKVALGLRTGGLFATVDALADELLRSGDASGEALWRLPLESDYSSLLSSGIADAHNSPGNPGGITAALFLKPFTGGLPWAHLDIAGPARAPEDDGILTRGATGFGARLLAHWVEARAA